MTKSTIAELAGRFGFETPAVPMDGKFQLVEDEQQEFQNSYFKKTQKWVNQDQSPVRTTVTQKTGNWWTGDMKSVPHSPMAVWTSDTLVIVADPAPLAEQSLAFGRALGDETWAYQQELGCGELYRYQGVDRNLARSAGLMMVCFAGVAKEYRITPLLEKVFLHKNTMTYSSWVKITLTIEGQVVVFELSEMAQYDEVLFSFRSEDDASLSEANIHFWEKLMQTMQEQVSQLGCSARQFGIEEPGLSVQ